MKRLLLAIVLSLPLLTTAASLNSTQKQIPIPECFPCEGEAGTGPYRLPGA